MKTIKSLLFLTEEDLPKSGHVAVEDLVKFFPSKHKQAIEKLWGTDRLTYKDEQFFDGDGYGPVYKGMLKVAKKALTSDEAKVTVSVSPDAMPPPSQKYRGYIESVKNFDEEIQLDAHDAQEVYVGYQPTSGNLWIGFDAWLDEKDLEDKIEEFTSSLDDADHSTQDAIGDYIFKEAKEGLNFLGVLMELTSSDGKNFNVKEIIVEPDGFYKGVHSASAHVGKYGPFSRLKLIDLRLD